MTKKPYDMNSPFMQELRSGRTIAVNSGHMPTAVWNLIISKRDMNAYLMGWKPHRHWRVTDVKKYFGIKGTGQNLVDRFMVLYTDILGDDEA